MLIRLVGLFFLLNIIDGILTHYLIVGNYQVVEANPIVRHVIDHYGWAGFWVYKILFPIIITCITYSIFKVSSRIWIFKWSCIGFAVCVSYMIGLSLFAIFGG